MLASLLASTLKGRLLGDDQELIYLRALYQAGPSDLSFLLWPKDVRLAKKSEAACIITTLSFAADFLDEMKTSVIVVDDVELSFNILKRLQLSGHFAKDLVDKTSISNTATIHKSAVIGKAIIGSKVSIGPHVVIADHVRIGEGSVIGANSVIGNEAFAPIGTKNLSSLGSVIIGNNTRIGALCTVDRGLIGATKIGDNCLLDNSVHIGHDVWLGNEIMIAAQSGLAGFVQLKDRVTLGGQVGIAPHVLVGENARISAKSGVHCDIADNEIWSGNPSMPHAQYLRAYAQMKRLTKGKINERASDDII